MSRYEIGVVKAAPLTMMWRECLSIWRTYRYAKSMGLPCREWYGVYEKGTEIAIAKVGPLPGAHTRASQIVTALAAAEAAPAE